MPTHIRPAIPTDVPQILQFIRELAEYEQLSDQVSATEQLLHQYLFGTRPIAECLLAAIDQSPVGFALYFHNFSTFVGRPGIYLEDLFVRPAARGKGVGRALLTHLAKIAVQRNCGRLEWAVLDWNAPAIGFYEQMGAKMLMDWRTMRVTGEALPALAQKSPSP